MLWINGSYNNNGYATAANGRFVSNQKIPLLPGLNTLWVEATSPDGSRGVDKILVYSKKNAQSPSVNITSPAEGAEVHDQFITISGSAGDAVQKVIVNESEAAMALNSFTSDIDVFSSYVYNPYGYERLLTAWAMDADGNIGHHDIPFRYRHIPAPTLSITSPLNGEVSGSSAITVTGNVYNASEVTVNGIPAQIDNNTFTATIDLTEGQNTITVIAKNTVKAKAVQSSVTYVPGAAITLQSITIEPSSLAVPLGGTLGLRAIGAYSDGTKADLTDVSAWTSSDTGIATVHNGFVTGEMKDASAIVSAAYKGLTGTASIHVTPPMVKSIMIAYESSGKYLTDNPVIVLGEPFQFKAIGVFTDGSLADISQLVTSWTSSNTAIAAIDSGGVVTANSKGTTEITATYGSVSAASTLTVLLPVYVFITSPVEGSAINSSETMVKGIVINTSDKGNSDTGVVINGIAANVSGYTFVANHVPVTEGLNTITAIATDGDGNTDRHAITVNAVTTGNYIRITSNIESGISPLEVTLKIDGSFSINESFIEIAGPASVEFLSSGPDEYRLKFIAEGVYYITVSSTDPDGNTYQDTVVITVLNKTELDALLKGKWEGMKEKLINRDVEGALKYFSDESKQHYNEVFTALYSQMPQLAQGMQDIQLITATGNDAKYRIRKNESYGGQIITITYYIYFGIDQNGIWKIIWY